MKLYPIHTSGIKAYCSDLIVDPTEFDTVYFLSVCGYQATVKGIVANFLENSGISIEIDGEEYYLERSDLGYKFQLKKLPSGFAHAVLFPKLTFPKNDENQQNSFYFFSDKNNGEKLKLFFRHLDEKTDLPLHPTWHRWLWQVFEEQEWIIELKTLTGSFMGYAVRFNPTKLHDLISKAIKNKTPEIITCLTWKGGDTDGEFDPY